MKISYKYIIAFCILLIIEIIIGLFVRDAILRPYVGDMLVVILMYTFIKGVVHKPIRFLPIYLFAFASAVELAQYFHIADMLQLKDNSLIATIIGTSFDIKDIFCYLIGTLIIVIWEHRTQGDGSRAQ